MLQGPSSALGFGRVENYQRPEWPNTKGSKQFHFDLAVDDLDAAAKAAVQLGATVPDEQPGETWRVLLDPAGHPFCLTNAANWG
jgi:predicted enzyme related to lactoylglutathione lyase